jgi:nitrate/nitrite transport system substrate-binding protein
MDRVIAGELDGAHMLAGQPIGATIGIGTKAHLITALSLDLNGNAITVSNEVWQKMQAADPRLAQPKPPHPISAKALAPVVEEWKATGRALQMGMVFPLSTHNYELRYWLAAGGIHPGFYTNGDATGTQGADVNLVTPADARHARPGRSGATASASPEPAGRLQGYRFPSSPISRSGRTTRRCSA